MTREQQPPTDSAAISALLRDVGEIAEEAVKKGAEMNAGRAPFEYYAGYMVVRSELGDAEEYAQIIVYNYTDKREREVTFTQLGSDENIEVHGSFVLRAGKAYLESNPTKHAVVSIDAADEADKHRYFEAELDEFGVWERVNTSHVPTVEQRTRITSFAADALKSAIRARSMKSLEEAAE